MKTRPRTTIARPRRTLGVTPLARCGADYLADCRARNLSNRTIAHYERGLEILRECLPSGPQWHTAEAIRASVAALREQTQYGKASLSMYLRAWRAFLRFCHREELVTEDLARYIKPPKVEPRRDVILSVDDVQRLLAAARQGYNGVRDVAMLTLLFDTGIRAGELIGLQVANVDLGSRTLTVPTGKTGGRSVPIGRITAKALRDWLRCHPTGDGVLFPSNRLRSLTPRSLHLCLERIGQRAGVTSHPHQWRHSFSVNYLRNGGDVFSLQRILGHSTLQMSRWYAELADSDVQAKHAVASPADRLTSSMNRQR